MIKTIQSIINFFVRQNFFFPDGLLKRQNKQKTTLLQFVIKNKPMVQENFAFLTETNQILILKKLKFISVLQSSTTHKISFPRFLFHIPSTTVFFLVFIQFVLCFSLFLILKRSIFLLFVSAFHKQLFPFVYFISK